MAEYDDLLAPYAESQGRGEFPSFLPLPPVRRPAELRNIGPRPGPTFQEEIAANISPLEAGRGMADILHQTYGAAREGDWSGVADRLPLALGMFAGMKAKTANLPALERAQTMAAKGAPREAIWNDTGWFLGPDKKWRFEINDSAMKHAVPLPEWLPRNEEGKLIGMAPNVSTAWDAANRNLTPEAPVRVKRLFEHPDLARSYPHGFTKTPEHGDVTGIPVMIQPNGPSRGAYDPSTSTMLLNEALTPRDAKSAALHELQHIIQRYEDHAPGGNPAQFLDRKNALSALQELYGRGRNQDERDAIHSALTGDKDALGWGHALYKRLAGEVEARNVQKRMDMTPEERRAIPPWQTQDIPDVQQLLRYYDGQ